MISLTINYNHIKPGCQEFVVLNKPAQKEMNTGNNVQNNNIFALLTLIATTSQSSLSS